MHNPQFKDIKSLKGITTDGTNEFYNLFNHLDTESLIVEYHKYVESLVKARKKFIHYERFTYAWHFAGDDCIKLRIALNAIFKLLQERKVIVK